MDGCAEVMVDCGCYDPNGELDCYKKALNYIRKNLSFEPNNACAVLAYVEANFKCSKEVIVRPDTPEYFPELNLPTPNPGSNNNLPPKDGPYDEAKRKPIWWYHTDHLGSSTYLTDNFGRPTHYYETLPFGEMMVEHNQSASHPAGVGYSNKYKFNGKELDDATQMYYYGARYYDPRISIFVSVDPLAEDFEGWTSYHYVHNNPTNLIDPTGMNAEGPGDPPKEEILPELVINVYNSKRKSPHQKMEEASGSRLEFSQSELNRRESERRREIADTYQRIQNYRDMGVWDDNKTYDNWFHAVGSQLSLAMPSARFNGLFNIFSKEAFTVNASKFDYFFGRVVSGPEKNVLRSAQNLKDLTTLGVKTEAELTKLFGKAFKNAMISTQSTKYGTTVVKSVNIGNKGAIEVGFFYKGGNMNSTPSVSSIIPKIYK